MSNAAAMLNPSAVPSSDYLVPDDLGSWKPWQANNEAIGEHKHAVARALAVSYEFIKRQCRSHFGRGTGKCTDEERIVKKVNVLRKLGVPENRAMLTVFWINDACGYEQPLPKGGLTVLESLLVIIGRISTEASDVVREGNRALADNDLNLREIDDLDREARDIVAAVQDFRTTLRFRRSRLARRAS